MLPVNEVVLLAQEQGQVLFVGDLKEGVAFARRFLVAVEGK